jgi:3-vinyl bacteriochlorophyllide hydratase
MTITAPSVPHTYHTSNMTGSLEQARARRSASIWTKIHPLFALGQLVVFFVSLALIAMYATGHATYEAVHVSVLVKIALMVGAVITGALWEHDVYGPYWFAPEFFFEDAMTMNVFILHLGYLAVAWENSAEPTNAFGMLLIAYAVYIANVGQYILRTMQQGHHVPKQAVA